MKSLAIALMVVAGVCVSEVQAGYGPGGSGPLVEHAGVRRRAPAGEARNLMASAALNTTFLYTQTFNVGSACNEGAWTKVDLTAQTGTYFHVDDFAGLAPNYAPLFGTKSLWCGARPQWPGPVCGYQTLPGYGNNWDQAWCSRACLFVSGDGLLDVSFDGRLDSQPFFDYLALEVTDCSGASPWARIEGGPWVWDGRREGPFFGSYAVGTDPVRVRLRFHSDPWGSDEDGGYPSTGAVVIDDLQVEGLAMEDFEGEAVGATGSNDWLACNVAPYGNYMALFPGTTLVQQDACARDLSCVWAAIQGSTADYACGGFPASAAVPFGKPGSQYLHNEIWSPQIALAGNGGVVNLKFSVYNDLPPDNLVFYYWRMRNIYFGCERAWKDRGLLIGGYGKNWQIVNTQIGDQVDWDATSIQVALGVIDMCWLWCGSKGTGACHSPAPYFDNVTVYRVEWFGPQWHVFDFHQFQDNFSTDGTITGTVRADMARDITHWQSTTIQAGDSAVVQVKDPINGLALDPASQSAAVYCHVSIKNSPEPVRTGAALTDNPARFPLRGTWVDNAGVAWTILRMDSVRTGGRAIKDEFCVDLNDNLFIPGDTVYFFYSANGAGGEETCAFGPSLEWNGTRDAAAFNPAEFTCLPAVGRSDENDILYVDTVDGNGYQEFFDSAFDRLGLRGRIDRFDQRGPGVQDINNGISSRVRDVQQLGPYRKLIIDCGDWSLSYARKESDWALIMTFLNNLTEPGGLYVGGDKVAEHLYGDASFSANEFKIFMSYTLTTGNTSTAYGVTPTGIAVPGGCFVSDPSFVLLGGCPTINGFDAMAPSWHTRNEITYGPGGLTTVNGAVLSVRESNGQAEVGALMGGFSLASIGDNDWNGIPDRVDFLYDAITWLGNVVGAPTPVNSGSVNSLGQNYPNPFNPQTTIAFSLKNRGRVTLRIYSVAGELVRALVDEDLPAGAHRKVWNGVNEEGRPASSGIYFYKLVAGDFSQTKRMALLK